MDNDSVLEYLDQNRDYRLSAFDHSVDDPLTGSGLELLNKAVSFDTYPDTCDVDSDTQDGQASPISPSSRNIEDTLSRPPLVHPSTGELFNPTFPLVHELQGCDPSLYGLNGEPSIQHPQPLSQYHSDREFCPRSVGPQWGDYYMTNPAPTLHDLPWHPVTALASGDLGVPHFSMGPGSDTAHWIVEGEDYGASDYASCDSTSDTFQTAPTTWPSPVPILRSNTPGGLDPLSDDGYGLAQSPLQSSIKSRKGLSGAPLPHYPSFGPSSSRTSPAAFASNPYRTRASRDELILEGRAKGMSYKQIKQLGNLPEAESTLRGRHRTLTKQKADRVRIPVWNERDVSLFSFVTS